MYVCVWVDGCGVCACLCMWRDAKHNVDIFHLVSLPICFLYHFSCLPSYFALFLYLVSSFLSPSLPPFPPPPSLCSWPVRTLSFSHDSQLLASASEDLFIDIVSNSTRQLTSAFTALLPWEGGVGWGCVCVLQRTRIVLFPAV